MPTHTPFKVEYAKQTLCSLVAEKLANAGLDSTLVSALLSSRPAAEILPDLATVRDIDQVRQNAESLLSSLPKHSRHRSSLVGALTNNLGQRRATTALNVTASRVKQSRRTATASMQSSKAFATDFYQPNVTKTRVPVEEVQVTGRWANDSMHVGSGTHGEVYTMVGTKQDFYQKYRHDYLTKVLGKVAELGPSLRAKSTIAFEKMTSLQRGLEVAVRSQGGPVGALDACHVKPRSERVFWDILPQADARFRQVRQPYECETCLYKPEVEVELPDLRRKMVVDRKLLEDLESELKVLRETDGAMEDMQRITKERTRLYATKSLNDLSLRELMGKERKLILHRAQYVNQRPFVKNHERGLTMSSFLRILCVCTISTEIR